MYAGIALCSMGVLMQEVLLTRIFSLTIWYHLAYLTISTALLGFAAAGSLLASRPQWLARGAAPLAAWSSAGAGIALIAATWLLGTRPIDPSRLATAPWTLFLGLLGYYAVVALPFLFAGLAVVAPLSAHPERADRLYAADLFGAGLGCLAAVAALTWCDGAASILLSATAFAAAAVCYAQSLPQRLGFAALAAALLLAAPRADRFIRFLPAPTKALGVALRDPRTEVLFTRWSPVNRVDVFRMGEGRGGGWWGANGLSKRYAGPLPRVVAIQYDGHNGSDVHDTREPDALRMLDRHLLRTPYALRPQERVLVIGVGGGIDVQNALRRGAHHVTGVDLQPISIDLHRGLLAPYTGEMASRPEVELVASEGRHFVRSSDATYDLLQITAVDTFSAQTTGAYVLAESFLYTVEAFEDYFRRLADDGMVSVILGDVVQARGPPPLVTRLSLVAREALERSGVSASERIVLLTFTLGVSTSMHNLVVKKSPFTDEELDRLEAFASENGFRVDVSPRGGRGEVFDLVHKPHAELASALRAESFFLEPATDDRPFFFNVLRWGSLFGSQDIFWMFPGSATGLLVLVMMLGQALLLGGLLIFLPLARRGPAALGAAGTLRFLLYFLGLGLGFMLIEISFVQKYVLLLGYPTYSLSVTIFALIVSAALGAALCRRFWGRPRRLLGVLLGATVALVALEVNVLPWIRDAMLGAGLGARIATTMALQFPLGLALGMYFPTGLELLRRAEPRLVPWAWAVNGVASVAATVLAVILGIELGFTRVALVAAAVYAIGTLSLWSALPPDRTPAAA